MTATARGRRLPAWSFSTGQKVAECPSRAARGKILREDDPAGPAAAKGSQVHDLLEAFVLHLKKNGAQAEYALPSYLRPWAPELRRIVAEADDIVPEKEVALTASWRAAKSWKAAKIRGKVDLLWVEHDDTLDLVDYKTGNVYPEHAEQLELYAVFGFTLYPWAERVRVADWYVTLEEPFVAEQTYTREADFKALLSKWQKRVRADLRRTTWPATRNRWCRTCPFNSKRGGDCVEGA